MGDGIKGGGWDEWSFVERLGSGEYDLALLCHSRRSGVSRGGRETQKREEKERASRVIPGL